VTDGYFANYNNVLLQLQDYGLLVEHIEVDSSRPIRCRTTANPREKRGWYWLSSFSVNGESLIIGAYGIFLGNDNNKQTVKLSKTQRDRLTPEQIAAQKARHKEAQKRAEADRQREADRAAARASKAWKQSSLHGESEYLQRKQIQAHGVRFSGKGAVVIPMLDVNDTIRGLQFILSRGHERLLKTGRDKEFWPTGLQMRGTFHLIGKPPRDILLIAEGYATAASLHEATGLPVAVVWTANNILPACQALKKKYRRARQLICADDDWLQKCAECGLYTRVDSETCQHCGQPHRKSNAGVSNAQAAAVAVGGSWICPAFSSPRPADQKGPTDFNDLHVMEGLALVSEQVEGKIDQLRWGEGSSRSNTPMGGGGKRSALKSILTVDEAIERFSLVFGGKGTMFDHQEHILVPKADVLDVLPEHGWRDMRTLKKVVRLDEVGFDPAGTDPRIVCNLWGGWPTVSKPGRCDCLLELLQYLCSNEENSANIYSWVLNWLAYPIQNPGAKMRTALIFHGPQGTGKNLFFESVMAIYGEYGRIVDQAAIEDKFNDWASKKLFLIADEVVARTELFHIKNKLKCFVTGEWIRINPKNVAAHDERNHVNLVFLSNESQPLVLEKDDRRYTVIHTPDKLDEKFYQQVRDEIKNGGISALHHHLFNLDLAGFGEHSKPPMTVAKSDLIHVSMDSVNSFIHDWHQGDVTDIPFCPCLGTQLYTIYRRHCERVGEKYPRNHREFVGAIKMMEGWRAGMPVTTHENLNSSKRISRKLVVPPDHLISDDHAYSPDKTRESWLTECYINFASAGGFAG
jgi:putative DNA primase/helicase